MGAAETLSRGSLTSFQDGLTLEKVLQEKKIPIQSGLFSGVVFDLETDICVTVLSPSQASLRRYENWVDKEKRAAGLTAGASTDYTEGLEALAKCPFRADSNPVNASSIGILLETGAHKMLFLGDALPADIANGLKAQGYSKENPCTVDLVKLSHHGSRHNTSPELLGLLHSKVFAISGNGTRGHPDKETLARIVATQEEPVFWFNQDIIHDIFGKHCVEMIRRCIDRELGADRDGYFELQPRVLAIMLFAAHYRRLLSDPEDFMNKLPTDELRQSFYDRVLESGETVMKEVKGALAPWFQNAFAHTKLGELTHQTTKSAMISSST